MPNNHSETRQQEALISWSRMQSIVYLSRRYEIIKAGEGLGLSVTGDNSDLFDVYVDNEGIPTIGIGFNLKDAPDLREAVFNELYTSTSIDLVREALTPIVTTNYGKSKLISQQQEKTKLLRADVNAALAKLRNDNPKLTIGAFRFQNEGQIISFFNKDPEAAISYEAELDERLTELGAPSIPENTYERLALVSLVWNGGKGILGNGIKTALQEGDRSKVWYEIRYRSNADQTNGSRRAAEAEVFGLFERVSYGAMDDYVVAIINEFQTSKLERVLQMIRENEKNIIRYEYGSAPGETPPFPSQIPYMKQASDKYGFYVPATIQEATSRLTEVMGSFYLGSKSFKTAVGALASDTIIDRTEIEQLPQASRMPTYAFDDFVYAGSHTEGITILLGKGDDGAVGGLGDDTLSGVNGRDSLNGKEGINTLDGGEDADVLIADGGTAHAKGGPGLDTYTLLKSGYNQSQSRLIIEDDDGQLLAGGRTGGGIIDASSSLAGDYYRIFEGNTPTNMWAPNPNSSRFISLLLMLDGSDLSIYLNGYEQPDIIIRNWTPGRFGINLSDCRENGIRYTSPIGTCGMDYLQGTPSDDVLKGNEGADNISAYGILQPSGNDTVYGGSGNDTIVLGEGNDTAYGESGSDNITDYGGSDTLYGGADTDTINEAVDSADAQDKMYGEGGNDQLYALGSYNVIDEGPGDGKLRLRFGDKTVDYRNNQMIGGEGNETFFVHQANALIKMGSGFHDITITSETLNGGFFVLIDDLQYTDTSTINNAVITIQGGEFGFGGSERLLGPKANPTYDFLYNRRAKELIICPKGHCQSPIPQEEIPPSQSTETPIPGAIAIPNFFDGWAGIRGVDGAPSPPWETALLEDTDTPIPPPSGSYIISLPFILKPEERTVQDKDNTQAKSIEMIHPLSVSHFTQIAYTQQPTLDGAFLSAIGLAPTMICGGSIVTRRLPRSFVYRLYKPFIKIRIELDVVCIRLEQFMADVKKYLVQKLY